MPNPKLDKDILQAAIIGFEAQKRDIDAKIAELRSKLPGIPASAEQKSGKMRRKWKAPSRRSIATKKERTVARKGAPAKKKAVPTRGTSGTGPRIGREAE